MPKWNSSATLYGASNSLRHRTPLHYFFSLPPATVIYKALDGVHRRQSLFGFVAVKGSRRADTTQEGAAADPQIINTQTFIRCTNND